MVRSPFRGGVTEAHKTRRRSDPRVDSLVSVFASNVFLPAGGKHSGGGRFDVQRHGVNTRRRRLGEAGGRWGVGCRKPGLNTQPAGRCAPPETAWTLDFSKAPPGAEPTGHTYAVGSRRTEGSARSLLLILPAVLHGSLCRRCCVDRMLSNGATTSASDTLSNSNGFRPLGCKYDELWRRRRRWGCAHTVTLRLRLGSSLSRWQRQGEGSRPESPQLLRGARRCLGKRQDCTSRTTIHATARAGCARRRSQLSIGHVAQMRATESEWHRKRSAATSRGAWLPALICMGGFARRQDGHERRSCWML